MFGRVYFLNIETLPGGLEGLRVNFKIEKSLVGYPNSATITIYNLSKTYRNLLEEEDIEIMFYAGYEDEGSPLIFSGQTANILHSYNSPDWETKIFAKDAKKALTKSTVNVTLGPGATTKDIFNTLVGKMEGVTKGLTEGIDVCFSGKQSLLRSLQLTGNIRDWLDKISKQCGFEYSVNDGIIESTQKDFALDDVPPFTINQSSGMIGNPERTDTGINVKNLLLPSLKLARKINIESITVDINAGNLLFKKAPVINDEGVYRIDKLIHIGDTHTNQWETQIIARNLL